MAQVANTKPEQHKVLHISAPEHMSTFILESIEQASNELDISRTVDIHPWADNVEQQINQGKIDYSFSTRTRQFENVQVCTLGQVKYWFLAVKKGHPILQQDITLEAILNHKLVLINNGQTSEINKVLTQCGQRLNTVPEVSLLKSSLFVAFEKIVNSNDICWAASVFTYYLAKKRNDIDIIDMTEFYNKHISNIHEWKTPSHLLQYHDAHEHSFTKVLTRIMKNKSNHHQLNYENSTLRNNS